MTSSNGHLFRVTGPLWGESIDHRWISITKSARRDFNTAHQFHTQVILRHRRFFLVKLLMFTFAASMQKQLTKLTPGYKNLDDMTPFQGGPRFCEMKTVSKAHIWQADWVTRTLGLYSLSGKTSYRKISWSLEAARFWFRLFQSLWNLAGTSAALLPRCLSNFRAIRPLQHPISRLRDFTRFGGKTSYRLVNRGPAVPWPCMWLSHYESPSAAFH